MCVINPPPTSTTLPVPEGGGRDRWRQRRWEAWSVGGSENARASKPGMGRLPDSGSGFAELVGARRRFSCQAGHVRTVLSLAGGDSYRLDGVMRLAGPAHPGTLPSGLQLSGVLWMTLLAVRVA
ncbi:hypothetical protein GCM10009753_09540 [Streptantibioticus ferralitis]